MLRGGVVDSVDREPQDGVMPPFFRAAPGAGEHCLSGAPYQGAYITSCPAVMAAERGACRPLFLDLPEESDSDSHPVSDCWVGSLSLVL